MDYQIVAAANSHGPNRVYDMKQVRQAMTNDEKGTTFLLAAEGLYVTRYPYGIAGWFSRLPSS